MNKKIKCGEGTPNIVELNINIYCEFCKKSVTTKSHLTKHLIVCKVKKEDLEEEVRILKEKLAISEALNKKPSTTIHNQNNNININLTPWNNPSLPEDIEKYYRESVKKYF
jgi:hypothetical protein